MPAKRGNILKIVAVIVLLVAVVGLAHAIEITARPDSGKQGNVVHGEEHEH